MIEETPPKDNIEKFWKGIWGGTKACNMSPSCIRNMEKGNEKVKEQKWENITVLELKVALTKSQKWKSPEINKVPNFLLNALSSFYVMLTSLLSEFMQSPGKTPEWTCERTTYLLKVMTQKTLKTVDQSLVFQEPTNF